jgi:hypothetical protein
MRTVRKSLLLLAFALVSTDATAAAVNIVLENSLIHYEISPAGRNVAFVDRATGTDYLRSGGATPCTEVVVKGRKSAATSAALANRRLTLSFGTSGITAVLQTEVRPTYITLRVESVSGGDVDSLTFLNIPLTLRGSPDEPFGACALALNLFTRVDALPALQRELRASCEKKFGLVGAHVAIAGAPMDRLLPVLQETLSGASELPVCRTAGPWAREITAAAPSSASEAWS